ncbi:polyprenyl synthetase family protein [soil metagenome]
MRGSRPGTLVGRLTPLDTRLAPTSFDERLDDTLLELLAELEGGSLPRTGQDLSIYGVLRYHLGYADEEFQPASFDAGKRIRPRICLLACQAAGGDVDQAFQVAAAIEMLHNFTLIHDDIQDQSDLRRHRPTVWSIWKTAQAINAGDALFAAAHLMLHRSLDAGLAAPVVLELSRELHRTTLRIVEGQVLDLGFESRSDVRPEEYLTMISGKSAAIMRYACFAGATVAGAPAGTVEHLAEFGQATGMAFQIRDDLLGVWQTTDETGKPAADDIRRRKKSLPVLLLRDRLSDSDWETVTEIYRQNELDAGQIQYILDLMHRYEIRPVVQQRVEHWHDVAVSHLKAAVPASEARTDLFELTEALVDRRA